MKLPSSFSADTATGLTAARDAQLTAFAGSIVAAARQSWQDRIIAEGNGTFDPRQLYTETHYALAAVLLFLQDHRDRSLLDLAEARLRLWGTGTYPLTFFNAMAVCLTALAFRRSGADHPGLTAVLERLVSETREHRHVAYTQYCGNNAYLQQVAIDTVLLPLARGRAVTPEGLALLLEQFRAYRTPEGFFFDLPRNGRDHERLAPPTYVMKMLFLLGVCHELYPDAALADLFRSGMAAARPLLSRDGNFSYFGRTDNSPFAVGLTIFNLRKAAALDPDARSEYEEACARLERFYTSFPRAASGVLESNRFGDAQSAAEAWRSKDAYAYVAQYSLASCAYAMLAVHWCPAAVSRPVPQPPRAALDDPAVSTDLGIVKLERRDAELIVRTRSEMTSWDRRYLGPTILRYGLGDQLLIGAISRTLATDRSARPAVPGSRLRRLFDLFQHRYVNGAEQLDATAVGFVPVLRIGAVDYVPYTASRVDATGSSVTTRHPMKRVTVRGTHPSVIEATQLIRGALPGLKRKPYVAPQIRDAAQFELVRTIQLDERTCRIEDRITGNLQGKRLIFSVRRLPGASIRVDGLEKHDSVVGWGSDGRHTLDFYGGQAAAEIRYVCTIGAAR